MKKSSRSRGRKAPTDWPLRPGARGEARRALFLDQLVEALRLSSPSTETIEKSATQHGYELLESGFSLTQVVHVYGDIGDAILELGTARGGAISAPDLHTSPAASTRPRRTRSPRTRASTIAWPPRGGSRRLGFLSHELRNLLFTAIIAYDEIKERGFGDGSTGEVLRRSLLRLGERVDRSIAEVRIDAGVQRRERFSMASLIEEASSVATLEANARNLQLTISPVEEGSRSRPIGRSWTRRW